MCPQLSVGSCRRISLKLTAFQTELNRILQRCIVAVSDIALWPKPKFR